MYTLTKTPRMLSAKVRQHLLVIQGSAEGAGGPSYGLSCPPLSICPHGTKGVIYARHRGGGELL